MRKVINLKLSLFNFVGNFMHFKSQQIVSSSSDTDMILILAILLQHLYNHPSDQASFYMSIYPGSINIPQGWCVVYVLLVFEQLVKIKSFTRNMRYNLTNY